MAEGDRIPDQAVVVRCGLPPFLGRPLHTACDAHPSGYYGFSVQAAVGLTVEQLAVECRNRSVGYTTAGEIRRMGYEVRETSGAGRHATVVVPRPWDLTAAGQLARLFHPAKNPSPKRRP
jgi:hypothetical protein